MDNNRIHFFHWPGIREHQKTLMQALALPVGARGRFHYFHIWPNDSIKNEKDNINAEKDCLGVLWILSCKEAEKARERVFDFACPARLLKNVKISSDGQKEGLIYVDYIAGEYLSNIKPYDIGELNDYTNLQLDGIEKPYPCAQKGYAYLSNSPVSFDTCDVLETESIYRVFENIPSGMTNGVKEPEIKTYPIIRVDSIVGVSPDEDGEYRVTIDKVYKVPYEITQRVKDRARNIFVNDKPATDRVIPGAINKKIEEGQDFLSIEVKFNDYWISVPIYLKPIKAIQKRTWPLIGLFILLAAVAILVFRLIPGSIGTSSTSGFIALISAIIVLFVDKAFDLLKK